MNGTFLAALVIVHAVAHLVGFAGPWGLIDRDHVTFSGQLLNGRVRPGSRLMRALSLIWLVLFVALLVDGVALAAGTTWGSTSTLVSLGVSGLLCLVWWPSARVGFVVNVILFTLLLLSQGLASL